MVIQLEDQELDVVMKSLMTQPWQYVNNVINKIMQQVNAQQQHTQQAQALVAAANGAQPPAVQ